MDILNLTAAQLKQAAAIKEQIAELENELHAIFGGRSNNVGAGVSVSESSAFRTRRNQMSAAGRARIIAAQKARWAKFKSTKGVKAARVSGKRRTMSAAAKAKIAAAARARWAKAKASGRNAL